MKNRTGKVINLEVGNTTEVAEVMEVTESIPNPAEMEPVATETSVNEDGEYDVSDLVRTGPRGVTNQGMIPALKEYISKGETGKLVTLIKCFPEIVESSLKYLGKKEQKKYTVLIG